MIIIILFLCDNKRLITIYDYYISLFVKYRFFFIQCDIICDFAFYAKMYFFNNII